MLIYTGEQWKGSLYGELSVKGPKLLLLSCPYADSRHQSGDLGFLVLFTVFTLPRVGCGMCLCTLSGSACVREPGPVESCAL